MIIYKIFIKKIYDMETYKINIDPRLFQVRSLSTKQIQLLAIIDDYSQNGCKFTLRNKDLHLIFNEEIGIRQIQFLISDLVNRGLLKRTRYGFKDHSDYYRKNFVVKRRLEINYDVLEKLIDEQR